MNFQLFLILILIILLQRLAELYLSRKNEKILRSKNAVESGEDHYPWMKLMHFLWFISLIVEGKLTGESYSLDFTLLLMALILFCQGIRFWTMFTLGDNWTTRILVIPNGKLIKKGPYRFFNHPNYAVVIAEFILIPLVYKCYATLIIFSVLNALLLKRRIAEENIALRSLL